MRHIKYREINLGDRLHYILNCIWLPSYNRALFALYFGGILSVSLLISNFLFL
jgi:hypothetical protein